MCYKHYLRNFHANYSKTYAWNYKFDYFPLNCNRNSLQQLRVYYTAMVSGLACIIEERRKEIVNIRVIN